MGTYRIGIYMRLSKEDRQDAYESNSIIIQRQMLEKYVEDHFSGYSLYEFADDGYTGTNFDRPGMKKMLDLIRENGLDCVIVKDLSRFARDYIELGSYLEQIFPFLGVRFISINDHYDSREQKGSIAELDLDFRNLLYDLYSKDLSQKVKTSLAARKARGDYVSANCPFGYGRSPDDRHQLMIEEDEAHIIRRIFELALRGHSPTQIAGAFNKEKIKTPIEFKIAKGKTHRKPKGDKFLWTAPTVSRILSNPVYAGDIAYGKYEREFYSGRNSPKSQEEWKIVKGHQEPIVSREIFQQVQNRKKKRAGRKSENIADRKAHPLTGKAVCGPCGRNLRYRHGMDPYFCCPQYHVSGIADCIRRISAVYLEEYVLYMFQERRGKEKNKDEYVQDDERSPIEQVRDRIHRIVICGEQDIMIEWK